MAAESLAELVRRYEVLRKLWRNQDPDAALDWQQTGIRDPDDALCVNNHYALSHVVLAAALLRELTQSERYGTEAAEMAEVLARQQAARYAPYEPGTIHWDFNNFAWLNGATLPHADRLRSLLHDPAVGGLNKENGTWAGNWLAMRQVNRALRRHFGLPNRNWRLWPEEILWHRLFRDDGGIDEYRDRSRPLQYHTYILALMLRRFVATGVVSARDERRLHAGTAYLLAHFDELGNANYRGRGQYQLFFEGCARYVLSVMTAWHGDTHGEGACASVLAKIVAGTWPVRADGLLALVRTDPHGERQGSHYDYHHVTVYNAFDLVWRLLALHDAPRTKTLPTPRLAAPVTCHGLCADSGIWLERAGSWLIALSAGEDMYLSDVGVTFCHLAGPRGVIFTAPGGPHPTRYGKLHGHDGLRANVFSPVYVGKDGHGLPHFRRGTLRRTDNTICASVDDGRARIDRRVTMTGSAITVNDRVAFPTDALLRHAFHWALPQDLTMSAGAPGAYVIGRDGELPLAALTFAAPRPEPLRRGQPFRGPGGLVCPWFVEADAAEEDITFTLELFE